MMTIGPGGLSSSLQDPTDPGQVVLTALEIDVIGLSEVRTASLPER
jgi:hypothetical protein